MSNDLAFPAPTDSNGNSFVGAVDPGTGHLHPLEGGTQSAIAGSPTGAASIRLVTETKDGGSATVGATTDTAYSSGNGSVIALLKGVFAKLAGTLTVGGSITANAGTNLNTSTLALEGGGNLAAAKTDLDTLVTQTAGIVTGARVALSSPPTNLTAGSDTLLTFASQVRHVYIQNKSSVDVNVAFDTAASAGTYIIPGGSNALMQFDIPCTVLHVLCASALNVNGTTGNNLTVEGRS